MEAKDLFAKHCKKKKLPEEWLGNPNVEINLMDVHEFINAIKDFNGLPVEAGVKPANAEEYYEMFAKKFFTIAEMLYNEVTDLERNKKVMDRPFIMMVTQSIKDHKKRLSV